jgi:preprotein translocase subunit SecF
LDKEFTLPVIAALLTIIGYSLNDTIVVYDRIRENIRRSPKEKLAVVVNNSINQTLSRTILTSGTTLIVVACLFLLGGEVIHDFSFALIVGVIVGTYSSIYIASPVLLLGGKGDVAARTSVRQG